MQFSSCILLMKPTISVIVYRYIEKRSSYSIKKYSLAIMNINNKFPVNLKHILF